MGAADPEVDQGELRAIESERTKLAVAEQTQRLVEKQAETERKRALIEAEKLRLVEAVQLERVLKQKGNEQQVAEITNQMTTARAKADADAELYRANKEAEANRARLKPEFIQYEAVRCREQHEGLLGRQAAVHVRGRRRARTDGAAR